MSEWQSDDLVFIGQNRASTPARRVARAAKSSQEHVRAMAQNILTGDLEALPSRYARKLADNITNENGKPLSIGRLPLACGDVSVSARRMWMDIDDDLLHALCRWGLIWPPEEGMGTPRLGAGLRRMPRELTLRLAAHMLDLSCGGFFPMLLMACPDGPPMLVRMARLLGVLGPETFKKLLHTSVLMTDTVAAVFGGGLPGLASPARLRHLGPAGLRLARMIGEDGNRDHVFVQSFAEHCASIFKKEHLYGCRHLTLAQFKDGAHRNAGRAWWGEDQHWCVVGSALFSSRLGQMDNAVIPRLLRLHASEPWARQCFMSGMTRTGLENVWHAHRHLVQNDPSMLELIESTIFRQERPGYCSQGPTSTLAVHGGALSDCVDAAPLLADMLSRAARRLMDVTPMLPAFRAGFLGQSPKKMARAIGMPWSVARQREARIGVDHAAGLLCACKTTRTSTLSAFLCAWSGNADSHGAFSNPFRLFVNDPELAEWVMRVLRPETSGLFEDEGVTDWLVAHAEKRNIIRTQGLGEDLDALDRALTMTGGEISRMVRALPGTFDFRFGGLRAAVAQSAQWHRNLGFLKHMEGRDRSLPPPWAPTPFTSGGYTFTHIDTLRGLREEGTIMRHCVATYGERVLRDASNIWRVEGAFRGTLELVRVGGRACVSQLRGKLNAAAPDGAVRAAHALVETAPPEQTDEMDDIPF